MVADLVNDQAGTGSVSVSLPSLRVDAFSVKIATEIQKVRRTGLTFAPEAGSWRLRQVINKLILEDDLYSAVDAAYSQGWRRVKLYFLTGLPTEMDDDTLGIAELANNVVDIGRKYTKQASCTVSVGGFVPEAAHAVPVVRPEQRRRAAAARSRMLRDRDQGHQGAGEVARPAGDVRRGHRQPRRPADRPGDRAGLAGAAARSRSGASTSRSTAGSTRCTAEGLDPDWYVTRHRTRDEVLPWDHIAAGLHHDFLWDDWQAALAEHGLPDCRWTPCYDCGVCTDYALEHVVASPLAPAGGSQGTGQDLSAGRRRARAVPRHEAGAADGRGERREGRGGQPGAAPVHEARARSAGSRTATSPARSSGRSASRSSRSRSPRASRPGRR